MSESVAFNEEYVSDKVIHEGEASYDFDFDAVAAALGEARESAGTDWQGVAEGMMKLLAFLLDVGPIQPGFDKSAGRRLIGFAWALKPDLFEGISIRELSKRLGYTAPVLSKHSAAATRAFGIRNGAKIHDWRNKK
jgi:hypothetical protein